MGAGAKICPPVALGWAWPLQSLLGERDTHADVYVNSGPLKNVLTIRSIYFHPHPTSGFPILLTLPLQAWGCLYPQPLGT